jgi:hypothetical protein
MFRRKDQQDFCVFHSLFKSQIPLQKITPKFSPNKNLAIGRKWFEFNVLRIELHFDVPNFPIHMPFFHSGKTPCLRGFTILTVHFHYAIMGDRNQFRLAFTISGINYNLMNKLKNLVPEFYDEIMKAMFW